MERPPFTLRSGLFPRKRSSSRSSENRGSVSQQFVFVFMFFLFVFVFFPDAAMFVFAAEKGFSLFERAGRGLGRIPPLVFPCFWEEHYVAF